MARARRWWGFVWVSWGCWVLVWCFVWGSSWILGDDSCQQYDGSSVTGEQRWSVVPPLAYCDYSGLPEPGDDPELTDVHPNSDRPGFGVLLLQAPLVIVPGAAILSRAHERRGGGGRRGGT